MHGNWKPIVADKVADGPFWCS